MSIGSSNALSRIGIIKESVFGSTPATPILTSQRFASANFSLTKPELLDDSKANTRQYLFTKTGNKTVGGSISGPLAHDNYDTLMESFFYNEWDSNVLEMGDDLISLTIEEGQPDIDQFKINRGCIVNTMSVQAPVDGLATVSFDILGLSQEMQGSTVSTEAYTAQPFRQPFTHVGGTISEGASPLGIVTDINFTATNNLETVHTWGESDPADLVPARIDVTGTMSVLFANAALYNKFINETLTSIEFEMDDGDDNTLKFRLGNVKYTGADMPIDSGSGLRVISLPFRAMLDSASDSTIVVTRSA